MTRASTTMTSKHTQILKKRGQTKEENKVKHIKKTQIKEKEKEKKTRNVNSVVNNNY